MSQSIESIPLVIRFQSGSIKYPEICPVCGEIATSCGRIIRAHNLKGAVPRIDPISRLKVDEVRQLDVPCCEKHHYSATEMSRIDSILGVLSGLSIFLMIFLSAYFPISWVLLTPIHPFTYSLYLFSVLVMVVTYRALGPSKLEKSISIVHFDHSAQTLILKIKNKWYYDELIRLNPFISI